jgi:mannitol/fructose-specific phosphotransferase system IIA component (Ntr-type)
MSFWKQFKAKACSVSLASSDKASVLEEVVGDLVSAGVLDERLRGPAIAALREREALATTGVGSSVAIPHVRLAGLTRTVAALSVHREGVEWASVDGAPVQVVFTVLRPEVSGRDHDPEQHLVMMRWIARLSRSSDFRSFALQAKSRTELVELLKEMASA